MRNSPIIKIIIALLSITLISQAYSWTYKDTLERHIYNKSNQAWVVATDVSVAISPCDFSPLTITNVVCSIAPHRTYNITYSNQSGVNSHRMYIIDNKKNVKSFSWYDYDNCLKHSGNTGTVTLNEPADGDIIMEPWADNWQASKPNK